MLDPLIRFSEYRAAVGKQLTPITLIGGFLGAGKTTLLNSLLHQSAGRRFAVLVNDFGELNIDAKLVVNVEGQTVELSNGCICCSINDDLVKAVMDMLARPEPPEHVLIETSGVSDPLNILFTFLSSRLREHAWIDNVVTVVDALHAGDASQSEYRRLFERQIEAAYTVVLNKIALAGAEKTAWARTFIEQQMPGAQIIETENGEVALPLLLDDNRTSIAAFRPMPVPDDSVHPFASVAWRSVHPLRRDRFEALIGKLRGAAFRAKGLIQFRHYPIATLFQMVGNLRTFVDGPVWHGTVPCTELVFIGSPKTLDRDRLFEELQACEVIESDAAWPIIAADGRRPDSSSAR